MNVKVIPNPGCILVVVCPRPVLTPSPLLGHDTATFPRVLEAQHSGCIYRLPKTSISSRLVLQAENILSTIRSHLGSSGIESALERIGIGSAVLGIRAIVLIDRE